MPKETLQEIIERQSAAFLQSIKDLREEVDIIKSQFPNINVERVELAIDEYKQLVTCMYLFYKHARIPEDQLTFLSPDPEYLTLMEEGYFRSKAYYESHPEQLPKNFPLLTRRYKYNPSSPTNKLLAPAK